MRRKPKTGGQAVLEYILLVVMLSVTVAILIRNTNIKIYNFWTGLARQVSSPCADCSKPQAPEF